MNMQALAHQFGLAFLADPWVPKVLLVLLATALAHLLAYTLLRHSEKITRLTRNFWDDALVRAASRPLPTALWVTGITLAARIGTEESGPSMFAALAPTRDVGIVVCLAWFLIRFIHNISTDIVALRQQRGEELDRSTLDAIAKLAQLSVLITTTLMVMQTLGFSISGLLAAGGIGGIALGFAAKDLLANFFGGLTIYLDRPFSVGEWIRSPDKEIEGTVEHINWRHTRIRTFNQTPLYVPNAIFTTIVVENPSRMTHRRIQESIGLRHQDLGKVQAIVADITTLLRNHPDIDTTQTLVVNFNAIGAASLELQLHAFTRLRESARYHALKQDVLLKSAEIITAHGAAIA